MPTKIHVIHHLSETAVLLPSLIGDALAANDRIKLRLSLLQEAALQAQVPSREPRIFHAERQAAGLDASHFDQLVAGARPLGSTRIFAPGVGQLLAGMKTDLAAMLVPLRAADRNASCAFVARSDALTKSIPAAEGDQLDVGDIDALASATNADRDSVHLLVGMLVFCAGFRTPGWRD
jgi:hypothetical protein